MYLRENLSQQEEVINLFSPKVTDEMNDRLCCDFTDEEISDALFQIGPIKAPGPYGLPARFFQRNWGVMKGDIVDAVKRFFAEGIMPEGVNETSIVFIPKITNPTEVKDFRPISLCNVLYKIVSKCLVNCLHPVLNDIVTPNQSAFIPGRLITDNALIAFECIHSIEQCRRADNFCVYKLDLSKAYDHVDWSFLKKVLEQLGFQSRWVQWVMECVTTV
jgi:hypothetical protein